MKKFLHYYFFVLHCSALYAAANPIKKIVAENNNNHLIAIDRDTGEVEVITDSKEIERRLSQVSSMLGQPANKIINDGASYQKRSDVLVVNDNSHRILQNNSQQQEVSVAASQSFQPEKIGAAAWYTVLLQSMKNNKMTVLCATLGMSWFAILTKLLYQAYTISSNTGWGNWYGHIDIENAYQEHPSEITQKLLSEIHNKYGQRYNNLLSMLAGFIHEADEEIKQLRSFLNLHATLHTLKIAALFPTQNDEQLIAMNRIVRLELLKKLMAQFVEKHAPRFP